MSKYEDAIWSMSLAEINHHRNNYFIPGYTMSSAIANWPGNGDVTNGVASILAPFKDLNENDLYEPMLGEYPVIRGEKAVLCIYNDEGAPGVHGMSLESEVMGVEVHAMFYQYSGNDYKDSTTYMSFKVFNRGIHDYDSLFFGLNIDIDLGYYNDDYAGCDSAQSLVYFYNGDNFDDNNVEKGHGWNPPSVGVKCLNHELYSSVNFMSSYQIGHPYQESILALHYFNQLNGFWSDGSQKVYGGLGFESEYHETTYPTKLMYTGHPLDSNAWSMRADLQPFSDHRVLFNGPPVSMSSGDFQCFDYAVLYNRASGNHLENVAGLIDMCDQVQQDYEFDLTNDCILKLGLTENDDAPTEVMIYPNPAMDYMVVKGLNKDFEKMEIFTQFGLKVHEEKLTDKNIQQVSLQLSPGLYLVHLTGSKGQVTKKVWVH